MFDATYCIVYVLIIVIILWAGFGEGRTAITHTHKGECGQRSPPARER